jgi:hypothetical protein
MTSAQKPPQSGDGQPARGWHRFGRGDQAVRYTEAWEHETFAEEQARWERNDLHYARICEDVRQARERGGEALRRADEAKAEWDARVGPQRQANDVAQRAQHALEADQTARARPAASRTSLQRRKRRSRTSAQTRRLVIRAREGHHHVHTAFAIESSEWPAPGIMPEPVRVHDELAAAPAAPRASGTTLFSWPATRSPMNNEPIKPGVE